MADTVNTGSNLKGPHYRLPGGLYQLVNGSSQHTSGWMVPLVISLFHNDNFCHVTILKWLGGIVGPSRSLTLQKAQQFTQRTPGVERVKNGYQCIDISLNFSLVN